MANPDPYRMRRSYLPRMVELIKARVARDARAEGHYDHVPRQRRSTRAQSTDTTIADVDQIGRKAVEASIFVLRKEACISYIAVFPIMTRNNIFCHLERMCERKISGADEHFVGDKLLQAWRQRPEFVGLSQTNANWLRVQKELSAVTPLASEDIDFTNNLPLRNVDEVMRPRDRFLARAAAIQPKLWMELAWNFVENCGDLDEPVKFMCRFEQLLEDEGEILLGERPPFVEHLPEDAQEDSSVDWTVYDV